MCGLFDNHDYALHSVVSHTQGCDLQNQQVADCFLLCECVWCVLGRYGVCRNVLKQPESFRQLPSNGDVFDIERERRKIHCHVFPECVHSSNDRA